MSPTDPPKTPTREHSLNNQVVLDEDEYTAALSHIIARDFFPSLVHPGATNSYLNAPDPRLTNISMHHLEQFRNTPYDNHQISSQTPSRTPYTTWPFDTPSRDPHTDGPRKRPRLDASLSLDSFQAKYTSEDNSSFTRILDEENRKRKEHLAWAWDAQKRVERQQNKIAGAREKMLIEAPPLTGVREKFRITPPTSMGLLTDGREGGEGLEQHDVEDKGHEDNSFDNEEVTLGNPDGQREASKTDVMARMKDSRSAGVDAWKFKARNTLMFPPDVDDSPYHPLSYNTQIGAVSKSIQYESTRLSEPVNSFSTPENPTPPSPTRSYVNAAITGTPYHPRKSINNFPLVPNLPSPTATELGPVAVKQLMTWGTLDATPRIISNDNNDLPPPTTPFHLPNISPREIISQRLSSSASKSLRAKAGLLGLGNLVKTPGFGMQKTPSNRIISTGKKGSMAPPTWTPRRSEAAGNLTPAARRLLERSTKSTVATAKRTEVPSHSNRRDDTANRQERGPHHRRWTPISN